MVSHQRLVASCLIGLAIALLIVGVVSGTVVRHFVQIVPIILAGAVLARSPHVGAYAAVPIFLFWIFIVLLIWLFLFGLSGIASGHYTVIEVVSTVFMAGFSLVGVKQSISLGAPVPLMWRVLLCIVFGVVQVAAMWASFLKPIADR